MTRQICAPRIYGHTFLLAVVAFLGCTHAFSQTSVDTPAAARVRTLNNSLLNLHAQMQQSGANSRWLRGQAAAVIAQRAATMASLIQNEPKAALRFAFSPELLADLSAKFPQSSSSLESHATITGPVLHWIADYPHSQTAKSVWQMNVQGKRLTLYFAGKEPANFRSGDLLQVNGVVSGAQMAVEKGSPVASSSAASLDSKPTSNSIYKHRALQSWQVFGFVLFGLVLGLPATDKDRRQLRAQFSGLFRQAGICALMLAVILWSSAPGYAQNSCTTKGVQNTVVLLVNLPNGSLPPAITPAAMQDVFFASNTAGVSLDGFLREASYGQTSATGDVFGPYNLAGNYTSCQDVSGAILNDAVAAAIASGVNFNNYTRMFLVFPDIFNCGWQGFASVGGCSTYTSSGTFAMTTAYLSAVAMTPRSSGVQVASHEIGHNFGLLHSGTLTSATASDVIGPLTAPGSEADLGDYWSTMGEAVLGLYPASQKINTLGWMTNPTNYKVVNTSGSYTIEPLEANPQGLEVLQIQRGTGNPGYYLWVEYRQPTGNYDSTLMCDYCRGGTSDFSGALIHYQDPTTSPAHTYLPNFTPSDPSWNSPALAVGQSWTDPYSNLSLSVTSATSTGLTLNVSYGAVPCTQANPTVTMTPQNPSVNAGNQTSYSITVTSNDSSGCSANTFMLSSSQPSTWPTNFSPTSLTLSPGQSGNATMYKTSPSGTAPGTYGVDSAAADNSNQGNANANVTVVSAPALSLTVSVPSPSYTRRSVVPITATALYGGTAASGANVTFTLLTASGSTVTQSSTTNSNGIATWNYKLGPKSSTGTYSVSAQASYTPPGGAGTQPVTSNTASFTVH